MNSYVLTWIKAKVDDSCSLIEHPLLSTLIPKEEFEIEFGLFLNELDGSTASDYFDFYFERCYINKNIFRFRDEDAKTDFLEACMDLNIIPSMKEILSGESKEDKQKRKDKSAKELHSSFVSLKIKETTKKYHTEEHKSKSKFKQMQETFETLVKNLETEQDPEKKSKYQRKLDKVIQMMEHSI